MHLIATDTTYVTPKVGVLAITSTNPHLYKSRFIEIVIVKYWAKSTATPKQVTIGFSDKENNEF